MLARALKPVLLAKMFPRTLVQLTLQILRAPPATNPPGPFAHSVTPPSLHGEVLASRSCVVVG